VTRRRRSLTRIAAAIALAAPLVGCSDDAPLFGPPTESQCPPDSALTWDSFGRKFMEDYCTRCHHSDLRGAARQGAPSFHDYDTVFGVRATDDHIDFTTAAGPAATNTAMPPDGPKPSLEERRRLGEWIACGAP
jgi:hypothetical protein